MDNKASIGTISWYISSINWRMGCGLHKIPSRKGYFAIAELSDVEGAGLEQLILPIDRQVTLP